MHINSTTAERLKSRGCYFLRTQSAEKPVKVDVATDPDLLFGEIAQQPLESLDTSLKAIFLPAYDSSLSLSRLLYLLILVSHDSFERYLYLINTECE